MTGYYYDGYNDITETLYKDKMIPETDRAYIAGLFDGEGSIHFKRGPEKKKKHRGKPGYRISNSLRLSMEVTMTDKSALRCGCTNIRCWHPN